MPFQVILNNGISAETFESQSVVALSGSSIPTVPALKPRSVKGIFLRQTGECQIPKYPSQQKLTTVTFSILPRFCVSDLIP